MFTKKQLIDIVKWEKRYDFFIKLFKISMPILYRRILKIKSLTCKASRLAPPSPQRQYYHTGKFKYVTENTLKTVSRY